MRDLNVPPVDYRPLGWSPRVVGSPGAQQLRAQHAGRLVAGSRNGLHSGSVYYGAVPSPWYSRPLASGIVAPTTSAYAAPGVLTSVPGSIPARPRPVIG